MPVRCGASKYGGIAQLVEHSVHTRSVICSSQIAATRPVGQAVKTPPFHGGNMGSIPVRVTKKRNHPPGWFLFLLSVCQSEPIGFDHKHLKRASAAAAFAAAVLTCASKQMRSGTPPALPAAYSRTDLLLIQSFAWHTNHPIGWFLFLLSVCRSEPIGFDHKHFAIARWPRCTASRLLAKPKENAPWHEGGSAAGVFPYRSAVDPKLRMAQNHPSGWFLFAARMLNRSRRQCLKIECRCVIML